MKQFFTTLLLLFFVLLCNAQLSRHYWIEDLGVNYTLASKIGQNGFILAATTQDTTGSFSSGRFTKSGIIIMKLRQNYSIESAKIFKYTSGDSAYNYDFEIYDVYAHGAYYFICGKMNSGTDSGIVCIVDTLLNAMTLYCDNTLSSIHSIYAQNTNYYACGTTYTHVGAVLERSIPTSLSSTSPCVTNYYTCNYPLYKIKAKNTGNIFNVVGYDDHNIFYCSFDISNGIMVNPQINSNGGYSFFQNHNRHVSITNYPNNNAGQIIATSDNNDIHIYMFNDINMMSNTYYFHNPHNGNIYLNDINCAPNKLAIVGYIYNEEEGNEAFFFKCETHPGQISNGMFAYFPTITNNVGNNTTCYLYKVQYTATDTLFHCGGYYYDRGNATTCIGAPEFIWHTTSVTCALSLPVNIELGNEINLIPESIQHSTADCVPHIMRKYNRSYNIEHKCYVEIPTE